MSRTLLAALAGLVVLAFPLLAEDDIGRGKLKKVDAARGTVTITVDGTDREFTITDTTRLVGASGEELTDRLKDKGLKEGTAVMFKAEDRDGKKVLLGMKLTDGAATAPNPGDIRRAKIKKIDLDKMVMTLTVGDKDQEFTLTEETRVIGAEGKDLKERLKGFKEGADIQFRTEQKDGKAVLIGVRLATGGDNPNPNPRPALPKVDTSKLKPLDELGPEEYQGYKGGFYPDGKNERPAAHEKAGLELAKKVQPLGADGEPSANGKIVILSVGMSNTSQSSEGFRKALEGEKDKNPHVQFINGAVGGMTAAAIQDPGDGNRGTSYWAEVDKRLKQANVTRAQVQVIWIKEADAGPSSGFPKYAQTLQAELAKIVQIFPQRFPNAKLVYLSSRTYGGYAKTPLNPEPYAYESGFSVKWLIEQQIKGDPALNFDPSKGAVKAPWLSWGPYLWANGTTKRAADGFFYEERDFANDGTHQSASGQEKVGGLLLKFFKTDSTTKTWFLK